jgi:hypothetical protein
MPFTLTRLPAELLTMIERGCSVIVGSRDEQCVPSVVRALGSRVDPARGCITVYLWQPQAAQVLEDIAATGHLAVVYSQPSTHRTVQFKARRADIRAATAEDEATLLRYRAAMEEELSRIGFPPQVAQVLLRYTASELVAVGFEPELAFDQTPGPRAGQAL